MNRSERLKNLKAFSMIEMLIVVGIIAIVAAVSVFHFSSQSQVNQLNSASQRLVSDLRTIRHQAKQDQTNKSITFNEPARSYSSADGVDMINHAALKRDLSQQPYGITQLSLTREVNPEDVITFNARGRVDEEATIVLWHGNLKQTIVVNERGRIKVLDF